MDWLVTLLRDAKADISPQGVDVVPGGGFEAMVERGETEHYASIAADRLTETIRATLAQDDVVLTA
ncbi:hypothetical protein UK15_37245 [Streptomyces variegatus]|uniref:Uncharacterized protein n=1 Tax=Streptomyces variegatus TaxID=284040 RepID=A0A0M2GH02_9ACTN|nr:MULTISPECIES: hypothetical protein [Streptomyces]KJK34178.1 hypothetical protein UK15_37245 [Streptomyces variegatus]